MSDAGQATKIVDSAVLPQQEQAQAPSEQQQPLKVNGNPSPCQEQDEKEEEEELRDSDWLLQQFPPLPTSSKPTKTTLDLEAALLCPEDDLPPWNNDTSGEDLKDFNLEEQIFADLQTQQHREKAWKQRWDSVRTAPGRKRSRHKPPEPLPWNNQQSPATKVDLTDETTPRMKNKKRGRNEENEVNDYLITNAAYLRYSWKELQLGTVVGTPAYNNCLQQQISSSGDDSQAVVQPVPPLEILEIVQSLRAKTVYPPRGSELQAFVVGKPSPSYSSHANDEEDASLQICMGRLYQAMCRQDSDDWSNYKRRSNHWKSSDVRDKLRRMENQIQELQQEENTVLQGLRESGVVTANTMEDAYRLLGVVTPTDDYE
jgi:hypothetical protein